ncbi:MAG TPA: hypothetical protein VIV12_25145 [Streptosporangiaceae bacterium]
MPAAATSPVSRRRCSTTDEATAARAPPAAPCPVAQIGPVHPAAQHGDLMPERENLDLLGPVTAPEQDQELKDTAEGQV